MREAAEDAKVAKDSAMRAFWELQAKGFIRPAQIGRLGVEGEGKATTWELTEFPPVAGGIATKDFLQWTAGNDFPVVKGRAGKKQNPVPKMRTSCPKNVDVGRNATPETSPACPKIADVSANIAHLPVPRIRTPKDLPPKGSVSVA
ncbi:MAG: hypothetical protein ACK4GO_17210 [Gemmobacter sp.]